MKEIIDFNIRPNASILKVFSRLNYKPWYAIAEFVDNSTQSFYSNIGSMEKNLKTNICIEIQYDSHKKELTIKDNAYGMNLSDFKRAILLDSTPDNVGGRNEFGMGLKTAASWFGEIWSVESTQLGSDKKYFSEINIPNLENDNLDSVDIITSMTNPKEHGTTIKIRSITKPLSRYKKIRDILTSMYRRDLASKKVEIIFNGENLVFEPYKELEFRGKHWKKDVDFHFYFQDIEHHITGFVGILEKGGFGRAGLALFRRDRVVIGGEDMNYKPHEIFGQAQSQVSLKLYGELNVDTFPVNQAKDGFVWDGGLEEEFLEKLQHQIQDYINIAKISVTDRVQEESISSDKSTAVEAEVNSAIARINVNISEEPGKYNDGIDEVQQYIEMQAEMLSEKMENKLSKPRTYKNINIGAFENIDITVRWVIDNEQWLRYQHNDSGVNELLININHPFFLPYSNDDDFKVVLEKFALSLVISEEKSKKIANSDGFIYPSSIRNMMNDILEQFTKPR